MSVTLSLFSTFFFLFVYRLLCQEHVDLGSLEFVVFVNTNSIQIQLEKIISEIFPNLSESSAIYFNITLK